LALELDQELARGVRLGLEGYYKHFEDIPDPEEVGNFARGVDVWVRRSEGMVSGWMGYSLAWYWSRLEPAADTSRQPHFSGRQTLSVGVAAAGRHGRAEAPLATAPGESAPPLSRPPRDFLRLDVQLSRTFTPRLVGRETALTPYVR